MLGQASLESGAGVISLGRGAAMPKERRPMITLGIYFMTRVVMPWLMRFRRRD